MGLPIAFALLASAATAQPSPPTGPGTRVTVSARASVVILSGAKVNLSGASQPDGLQANNAVITVEDGSRRAAKLVEFQ